MKRTVRIATTLTSLGLLAGTSACGKSVTEFCYGCGMPGYGSTEGGEALLERIFLSPGITQGQAAVVNQFHAYHYAGGFDGGIDGTNRADEGGCFAASGPTQYPVHDIGENADYVDWGESITLRGPGGMEVPIPKVMAGADGIIDNRVSPTRHHREGNFIYGGPSWQFGEFQNETLQPGGTYYLDVPEDGATRELEFHFPPSYDFPMDIGTVDVALPRTAPEGGFEVTWEAMPNPDTLHGFDHSFAFIALAAFPEEGDRQARPLFLCNPPDEDGKVVLSQEVLDALPEVGIIQAGRLTHYMHDLDDRRFDAFAIWCALSIYSLE